MNWCSALYIIIAVKINQKRWYRENKLIGMHKNGLILDLNNDVVGSIAEKTGIPKVDILVALEAFFKEVKSSLVEGEPVYVRGFGSFILKKRAAKIGRNIKKNVAVEIPEHFIPAFKPAKEFVQAVKDSKHELVEHGDADMDENE